MLWITFYQNMTTAKKNDIEDVLKKNCSQFSKHDI